MSTADCCDGQGGRILINLTDQGIKNIKEAPARVEMMAKSLEAAGVSW